MNYETVYQTVKTKVEALVPSAAVRVPNRRPAGQREIEISISVTETDSNPYTEVETKHNVSIDLLTSVPAGEGTERVHHIVSRLVAAFDPLQHKGGFWTDDKTCFVEVQSVSQKQPNITDQRYQINVRILASVFTQASPPNKQ